MICILGQTTLCVWLLLWFSLLSPNKCIYLQRMLSSVCQPGPLFVSEEPRSEFISPRFISVLSRPLSKRAMHACLQLFSFVHDIYQCSSHILFSTYCGSAYCKSYGRHPNVSLHLIFCISCCGHFFFCSRLGFSVLQPLEACRHHSWLEIWWCIICWGNYGRSHG